MWNLDLIDTSSSNCLDSMISSIVKLRYDNYMLYNIKYFYTRYFDNDNKIIKKNMAYDYIKDIFGFNINFAECEFKRNNFWDTIKSHLLTSPIGIEVDPYDCYWSPFYKTDHWIHVLLIVDADDKKKLTCFDIHYPDVGYINILSDDLERISKKFIIFDYSNQEHKFFENAIQHMQNHIDLYDVSESNKEMNELIKIITSELNQNDFANDGKIKTSKWLINLLWISEDKRNFTFGLKYLEEKIGYNAFEAIYPLMQQSSKLFERLKSYLMKYVITGKLQSEKITSIVKDIYSCDRQTIFELDKIIHSRFQNE